MGGHEPLQVEVGQLITILELEELLQLGIGQDATTVVLVLQLIVANVGVDLASNLGPGHFRPTALAKESGKLVGNQGRLHEAGWLAVDVLAALLLTGLASNTELTLDLALNAPQLRTESRDCGNQGLQLAVRSSKQATPLSGASDGNACNVLLRSVSGRGFGNGSDLGCLDNLGLGLRNGDGSSSGGGSGLGGLGLLGSGGSSRSRRGSDGGWRCRRLFGHFN